MDRAWLAAGVRRRAIRVKLLPHTGKRMCGAGKCAFRTNRRGARVVHTRSCIKFCGIARLAKIEPRLGNARGMRAGGGLKGNGCLLSNSQKCRGDEVLLSPSLLFYSCTAIVA